MILINYNQKCKFLPEKGSTLDLSKKNVSPTNASLMLRILQIMYPT